MAGYKIAVLFPVADENELGALKQDTVIPGSGLES